METMNLLKKSNKLAAIPVDIRTKPEDVAFGLDELIMFMGQQVIVALYDTGYDITATACEKMYDLPFYMAVGNKLPQHIDTDSLILLSATVLDPASLPYNLDVVEEAFVIYDEWDSNRFYSMEKVVAKVEETFEMFDEASIDDFTILAGVELPLAQKLVLIRRINNWSELNKEISDGRDILDS